MFDILGAAITIGTSIIAVGVGLVVVIWDGFRRQRQSLESTYKAMDTMNEYVKSTTKSGIYEKIAMLHGYTNEVPNWKDSKIITNKICFDIQSLWYLKSDIGDNETVELSAVIDDLTKVMKTRGKGFEEDADRIEHKSKPLFSK